MFKFSGSQAPKRILDVGCGFGGSSRWLAAQFPDAEVIGEQGAGSSPVPGWCAVLPGVWLQWGRLRLARLWWADGVCWCNIC
jgi:hypothetical protein